MLVKPVIMTFSSVSCRRYSMLNVPSVSFQMTIPSARLITSCRSIVSLLCGRGCSRHLQKSIVLIQDICMGYFLFFLLKRDRRATTEGDGQIHPSYQTNHAASPGRLGVRARAVFGPYSWRRWNISYRLLRDSDHLFKKKVS